MPQHSLWSAWSPVTGVTARPHSGNAFHHRLLVLGNRVMLQRTEHTGKRVAAIEAEVRQANAIRTGEEH